MSDAVRIGDIVRRLVDDMASIEDELGSVDDRATVVEMAHADLADLVVRMSEAMRLMRVDLVDIVTVLSYLGQRTQSWPDALDNLDRRHGVAPTDVPPYEPPARWS